MRHTLDVDALENLVAVARAGSITAAARALGQPKQSVSRRLASLEETLGTRLIERSTRALRLTAEGEALREYGERILAELDDARQFVAGRAAEPEGPLRISAPILFGHTRLGEVVARFCAVHPKVALHVDLTDRKVDLMEERIDAAVRVGSVIDASLVARRIATSEMVLVASVDYVERQGAPATPGDLDGRGVILAPHIPFEGAWSLVRGAERVSPAIRPILRTTSLKLAMDAAEAGLGIALVPALLAERPLVEGGIVRLLPAWSGGTSEVNVVWASRRLMAPRLRAFVDFLVGSFPTRTLLSEPDRT